LDAPLPSSSECTSLSVQLRSKAPFSFKIVGVCGLRTLEQFETRPNNILFETTVNKRHVQRGDPGRSNRKNEKGIKSV
jgi:hypothetical protein